MERKGRVARGAPFDPLALHLDAPIQEHVRAYPGVLRQRKRSEEHVVHVQHVLARVLDAAGIVSQQGLDSVAVGETIQIDRGALNRSIPYESRCSVAAPSPPGGAAAQASGASWSRGSTGHAAAKAAGVISPSVRWIQRWLLWSRHRSIRYRASASVSKTSDDSSSSRSRLLKRSTYPFSHGLPGWMKMYHQRTMLHSALGHLSLDQFEKERRTAS